MKSLFKEVKLTGKDHGDIPRPDVAGSETIGYTYDNNGNQLTVIDATGTTTRTYDALNRTLTKTVPVIGKSTYVYDITVGLEAGFVKETTMDPKGTTIARVHDKTGRLARVLSPEGTTTYEYYNNGNRKMLLIKINEKNVSFHNNS
jgi:YD repeat-containing protein